ncbi:MAG TPA: type II toxin-antitoxin system VapB family antitoxin [Vicinamibacterales bacterium]|nr:type II toxin-antitoxin system VapB family antitoxin [Vicinamibacterales bacterium]
MRTTLDLDDRLIRDAKKRAADDGDTLTGVIERALRVYLTPPPARGTPFKLDLLTRKGKLVPGIDWDDRNALYDRMDGLS